MKKMIKMMVAVAVFATVGLFSNHAEASAKPMSKQKHLKSMASPFKSIKLVKEKVVEGCQASTEITIMAYSILVLEIDGSYGFRDCTQVYGRHVKPNCEIIDYLSIPDCI
ncbi:hypothetical protein [Rhodoflexus caldus]|uniref:hypothetical protein n=1 Tax=Rhodoflexus caldus TaxID=2891236 RepID=UPI002029DEA7|nr:hypothetical protein [Rhodoflexus caldus]